MQQEDLSARLEPAVPGEDVSIALALVNTRLHGPDGPRDLLAEPADVVAWLAGHGLDPGLGPRGDGPDGDERGDGGRGDGGRGDGGRGGDGRGDSGPDGDRRSDGEQGNDGAGGDGRGTNEWGNAGQDTAGRGSAGRGINERGNAGQDTAGRGSAGRDSTGWGSAELDSAGWGDRLRELRESIRALLSARIDDAVPDVADLATVNSALAAAPCVTSVAWDEGGPRVGHRRTPRTDDPLAPALAALAADAGELLAGPHAAHLARCSAHRCIRMFIRTHAARQVCSTRCGDRVRAARHYAKRREQAAS